MKRILALALMLMPTIALAHGRGDAGLSWWAGAGPVWPQSVLEERPEQSLGAALTWPLHGDRLALETGVWYSRHDFYVESVHKSADVVLVTGLPGSGNPSPGHQKCRGQGHKECDEGEPTERLVTRRWTEREPDEGSIVNVDARLKWTSNQLKGGLRFYGTSGLGIGISTFGDDAQRFDESGTFPTINIGGGLETDNGLRRAMFRLDAAVVVPLDTEIDEFYRLLAGFVVKPHWQR